MGQVTLGDGARAAAARLGITERAVQLARVCAISEYEEPQHLVALAVLPDRRRIRLCCAHDQPSHVITLRLA